MIYQNVHIQPCVLGPIIPILRMRTQGSEKLSLKVSTYQKALDVWSSVLSIKVLLNYSPKKIFFFPLLGIIWGVWMTLIS